MEQAGAPGGEGAGGSAVVCAPTVGIFDSGIGGLTVAQAILQRRPDLSLVYYADTLNMPYGGRPPGQIATFARQSIEFLLEQGIDILALGCNASNSVLADNEMEGFGVPVFDLVGSTIDWLRSQAEPPTELAVIATQATIDSRHWKRKLADAFPEMKIHPVAAPEFVPLIEAQELDEKAIRRAVERRLGRLVTAGARVFLHGCTHFPFLQEYMEELAGGLTFIDPAECLAENLAAGLGPAEDDSTAGTLHFFNSLPGERFYTLAERLLGRSIRQYTSMYIVNAHED